MSPGPARREGSTASRRGRRLVGNVNCGIEGSEAVHFVNRASFARRG